MCLLSLPRLVMYLKCCLSHVSLSGLEHQVVLRVSPASPVLPLVCLLKTVDCEEFCVPSLQRTSSIVTLWVSKAFFQKNKKGYNEETEECCTMFCLNVWVFCYTSQTLYCIIKVKDSLALMGPWRTFNNYRTFSLHKTFLKVEKGSSAY